MRTAISVFLGLAAVGCGGSATLTESQEYYMARGVAALAIEKDHLWPDEKVEEYITLVGLSVAYESDRPETYKGYHFGVLNTDDINAFAAPSGFIFVTKGALRFMNNEESHLCLINTRFLMLRDGEIIFDGVNENLRQSQDEYIRRFLS